jgi:transposase
MWLKWHDIDYSMTAQFCVTPALGPARHIKSRPLLLDLEIWMRQQRALLSSSNDTAKAINYLLNRWAAFTRFLDDGRVCLSNNAAERALRGVAVGRKNWTFAGSDAGGHRAAAVYTLIETCLCRTRHRQVYAACRTMPSQVVFPRFVADGRLVGSA